MSMRLSSANTYDNALGQLTSRQSDLAELQEKLTAGKKVMRPSDDPTGAAQSERAMTRITRIDTEQRALNVQRNSMAMAESTLGGAVEALMNIRDLVLSAGNAGYSSVNRTNIAQQISSQRDQLFTFANKTDSNGVPLFGGLGSASSPFTDLLAGVTFNGVAGQNASSAVSIPGTLDGQSIWMNVPSGNGVFDVSLGAGNTGTAWAEPGTVSNPSLLTGHDYSITFSVSGSVTTYDVVDTTSSSTVLSGQPFTAGQAIEFDGMAVRLQGAPADLDTLAVVPSTTINVFAVIDKAINGINAANSGNQLSQTIARALAEIDSSVGRIQAARGLAGDILNRADNIANNQEASSVQLQSDRSRAEDMDMLQGISDFQSMQTGYDAALKTYAQVQRLSLFNYLS